MAYYKGICKKLFKLFWDMYFIDSRVIMDSMLLWKNAASTNAKGSWLMCNHMEKIWYLQAINTSA